MTRYADWSDIRGPYVEIAGGEKAVAEAREQLRLTERAYKLAEARRRRHISQRELAKTMGVSQARISQIEHGHLDVSEVATLNRYVEALGGKLRIVAEFDDDLMQIA